LIEELMSKEPQKFLINSKYQPVDLYWCVERGCIYPMRYEPGGSIITCIGCQRIWRKKKNYEESHLFVRTIGVNPKLDYTKTYSSYILYDHDKL
jgi:hypothetical protein